MYAIVSEPTHLSSKVPCQELNRLLTRFTEEEVRLGWGVDEINNVDPLSPLHCLVRDTAQTSQQCSLPTLSLPNQKEFNCSVDIRTG